jgi:hypothetical protein
MRVYIVKRVHALLAIVRKTISLFVVIVLLICWLGSLLICGQQKKVVVIATIFNFKIQQKGQIS